MSNPKQVRSKVKIHLLLGHSITQKECIELFNGYRLSDAIHVLRTKYGMNIEKEMCSTKDSIYARYFIPKPKTPCKTTTTTNGIHSKTTSEKAH